MKITTWPFGFFLFAGFVALALGCNILGKNLDNADLQKFRLKNQAQIDSLSRSAGMNVTLGVSDTVQFLARQVVQALKGFSDTLDPDIQKVFDRIGNLSEQQLDSLGKRMEAQIKNLKGEIKDEELKRFLLSIVEDATGKLKAKTRNALSDMIQVAIDSFDAEQIRDKLQIVVEGALDDSTQTKAQELVNRALQPTIDNLMGRIEKIVHKDVPFVQKQAEKLLIALALLALLVIGWVWYQRRRYARLVSLLTYNIDKIPSQELYDELTKRIRDEAQKNELEPLLRDVLKEQGINQ